MVVYALVVDPCAVRDSVYGALEGLLGYGAARQHGAKPQPASTPEAYPQPILAASPPFDLHARWILLEAGLQLRHDRGGVALARRASGLHAAEGRRLMTREVQSRGYSGCPTAPEAVQLV